MYHIISIDEAELAMRNLDKSGRGFLTNDKVFALMTQQMEQQKQLFRFKKIMIGYVSLYMMFCIFQIYIVWVYILDQSILTHM